LSSIAPSHRDAWARSGDEVVAEACEAFLAAA
jgi:hypothetical protein